MFYLLTRKRVNILLKSCFYSVSYSVSGSCFRFCFLFIVPVNVQRGTRVNFRSFGHSQPCAHRYGVIQQTHLSSRRCFNEPHVLQHPVSPNRSPSFRNISTWSNWTDLPPFQSSCLHARHLAVQVPFIQLIFLLHCIYLLMLLPLVVTSRCCRLPDADSSAMLLLHLSSRLETNCTYTLSPSTVMRMWNSWHSFVTHVYQHGCRRSVSSPTLRSTTISCRAEHWAAPVGVSL